MKKHSKYGNIILSLLLLLSFVANVYLCRSPAPSPEAPREPMETQQEEEGSPDIVEEGGPSPAVYGVNPSNWAYTLAQRIPLPTYVEQEIVNKMGDGMLSALSQIPDAMYDYDDYYYAVPYMSDTLFSIDLTFYYVGTEYDPKLKYYNFICFTFDLETGDILGLDDILDIEGFLELFAEEAVLCFDSETNAVNFSQLDSFYLYYETVVGTLEKCCNPQVKTFMQPTFYLTNDRIYFYNILPGLTGHTHTIFSVKLDDIRHLLKIAI